MISTIKNAFVFGIGEQLTVYLERASMLKQFNALQFLKVSEPHGYKKIIYY
jgi:hypothetical protein